MLHHVVSSKGGDFSTLGLEQPNVIQALPLNYENDQNCVVEIMIIIIIITTTIIIIITITKLPCVCVIMIMMTISINDIIVWWPRPWPGAA